MVARGIPTGFPASKRLSVVALVPSPGYARLVFRYNGGLAPLGKERSMKTEANDASLLTRLIGYLERQHEFGVIEMAELAPGVIGIRNDYGKGECDAYFDLAQWEGAYPDLWGDELTPPSLAALRMGVLEGIGKFPHVQSINDLLTFASSQLRPIDPGDTFHPAPVALEVPDSIGI